MKYTNLRTMAMLGLFFVLAVMTASAQTGGRIEASIPFDFAAGETKLKAGDYTVKRISKDALQLSNAQNKTSVIVMAPLAIQQPRPDMPERLVFKSYGNEYFLSEVWTNRAADGRGLFASKAENRLARQMYKSRQQPLSVDIVARTK
jgi:hypothetical protein